MEKNLRFICVISILAFAASCKDGPEIDCPSREATAASLRILPLGDSRVEGARPEYESYRFELWKLMVDNQWDIDFIGTREDRSEYPRFQNECFDRDHEGTGGATTSDILVTLSNTDVAAKADIVLMGIGGNDLLSDVQPEVVIENIQEIIALLQAAHDSVTILVEQIAPGKSSLFTPSLQEIFDEFNKEVASLPATYSTSQSKVIVVDMATGWQEDWLADEVHYNEKGAKVVADTYFEALRNYVQK